MSRIAAMASTWPVALQIFGGLSICFGVGAVAGLGWAAITLGIEALVAGVVAE